MSNESELLIPDTLRRQGYESGGELAWPRGAVTEVIDALTRGDAAILGGEVWIPSPRGPILPFPIVYEWAVDKYDHEPWLEYVKRANDVAKAYVEDFEWSPEDVGRYKQPPYFNLTFANQREHATLTPRVIEIDSDRR